MAATALVHGESGPYIPKELTARLAPKSLDRNDGGWAIYDAMKTYIVQVSNRDLARICVAPAHGALVLYMAL